MAGRRPGCRGTACSKSHNPVRTIGKQDGRKIATKSLGLRKRAGRGATQSDAGVLTAREGAKEELSTVFALGHRCQRADRGGATRFEGRKKRPLGGHGSPGVGVVQLAEGRNHVGAVIAALDRERALPWSGEHLLWIERLGDLVEPAQPGKSGMGEQDRIARTAPHQ